MSQALTLYRLQQIDSQLDRAKFRVDQIKEILKDDQDLGEAIQLEKSSSLALESCQQEQQKLEIESRAVQVKIEQSESGLYGGKVRAPKELQDLQNEVAALKRYLATLEDHILDAMLAVENASVVSSTSQANLATVQGLFNQKNKILQEEQANHQKDIERLTMEKHAIAGSVPSDFLDRYEQLRRHHRGLAVSSIQENNCSACGATLTLAQIQAARSPGQVSNCPSCGRILYGN